MSTAVARDYWIQGKIPGCEELTQTTPMSLRPRWF